MSSLIAILTLRTSTAGAVARSNASGTSAPIAAARSIMRRASGAKRSRRDGERALDRGREVVAGSDRFAARNRADHLHREERDCRGRGHRSTPRSRRGIVASICRTSVSISASPRPSSISRVASIASLRMRLMASLSVRADTISRSGMRSAWAATCARSSTVASSAQWMSSAVSTNGSRRPSAPSSAVKASCSRVRRTSGSTSSRSDQVGARSPTSGGRVLRETEVGQQPSEASGHVAVRRRRRLRRPAS